MLPRTQLKSIAKRVLLSLLIGLIITGIYIAHTLITQKQLSQNIVRCHVVANSDSPEDQILKLKVRDRIFGEFGSELKNCQNIESTKQIIKINLDNIECLAKQEIDRKGYNYSVKAELDQFSSFEKNYNYQFLMPAGEYEALKITIGEGAGQNWWGVIYPALCLGENGEILNELSEEEITSISQDQKRELIVHRKDENIRIRFKVLEMIHKARLKINYC